MKAIYLSSISLSATLFNKKIKGEREVDQGEEGKVEIRIFFFMKVKGKKGLLGNPSLERNWIYEWPLDFSVWVGSKWKKRK